MGLYRRLVVYLKKYKATTTDVDSLVLSTYERKQCGMIRIITERYIIVYLNYTTHKLQRKHYGQTARSRE